MAAETVDDRAVHIDIRTARDAVFALRMAQLRCALERDGHGLGVFERAADAICAAIADPS